MKRSSRQRKAILSALVLLVLTAAFLLSSCEPAPTWSDRIKDFYDRSEKGENVDLLAWPLPANKALDELTPGAWTKLRDMPVSLNEYTFCMGRPMLCNLENFNRAFPVERVEKVDTDILCAEYRLTADYGVPDAFLYAAFQRSFTPSTTEVMTDALKTLYSWVFTGEKFFVSRKLSSRDFSSLCVGSTGQDVYAIEPAIYYDVHLSGGSFCEDGFYVDSYRLLTDGILRIRLVGLTFDDDPAQLAQWTVTDMEFYPYGGKDAPDLPATSRVFSKHNLTLPK